MDPTLPDRQIRLQSHPVVRQTPGRYRSYRQLPAELKAALAAARLDKPYRDGGWTARQVVHHSPTAI